MVARVRLNPPSPGGSFVEYFIRATDEEVKAALYEDGAAAAITVGVYTRAASVIRSRQAAAKAASACTISVVDESSVVGTSRGAVQSARTRGDNGDACGVVPWQKRARTA